MVVYCTECNAELSRVKVVPEIKEEEVITQITQKPMESEETVSQDIIDIIVNNNEGDEGGESTPVVIETADDLKNYMVQKAEEQLVDILEQIKPDITPEEIKQEIKSELHDVALEYFDVEEEKWVEADKEHFPDDGKLIVVMPVPEGTFVNTHTYIVTHLITHAFDDSHKAGDLEYPEVTEFVGEDGMGYIRFEVTGLSPITITAVAHDTCEHDTNKSYTDLGDGTHSVICGGCGEAVAAEEHSYDDTKYLPHETNDDYHWNRVYCVCGDYKDNGAFPCEDENGDNKCDLCKQELHVCTEANMNAVQNGDAGYKIVCGGCGELMNVSGVCKVSNGDIYYAEEGIAVADKGLVRTVNTDGVVEYYYFGCTVNADTCPSNFQCDSYKAQKNRTHWLENTHDLLPVWDYTFDENGVIVHDEDTSKNGIDKDVNGVKCFYVDGIKVHKGLFIDNGKYYYARSSGELVVGREYWLSESHMNGLTYKGAVIEEGMYNFGADGAIVWPSDDKDGIYEEDGKLYYYVDGVRTYAGLIKIGNDYYYARTSGELAVGSYWVTKNNGLMNSATYQFGADGKMIRTNGLVNEDGGIYYYVDGNRFYAGLIEIDGDYYYVRTSGQVATNTNYWISKTNGLMAEGSYEFGADGKMILAAAQDGIVEVGGKLYYYVDGAPCYAGLIQYTGSLTKADGTVIKDAYQNAWIYVRTGGELAVNRSYWTTKHNDYMKAASYKFDANGVMVNPPV